MSKLQVAFQGGGAKLCALLAAGEVLQTAHNTNDINITRVAGTSAGAIVAAMIAAGIPITEMREALRSDSGRGLAQYYGAVPGVLRVLWCLLRKKPLRETTLLESWLNERLAKIGINRIAEIEQRSGIQLVMPAADLGSRTSVLPDKQVDVVQAILDSCAIPIFFRLWNRNGPTIVDGGIVENLPVGRLVREQESFGPVLAVAFAPPPARPPRNLVGFLYSVLDAAISAGEDRARDGLPASSVISLEPRFGTFDFKSAIQSGLDDFYELAKAGTESRLKQFLEKQEEGRRTLQLDPWSETNQTARFMMNQVALLYDRVERVRPIKYHLTRFSVFANSLRSPDDPLRAVGDVAEFVIRISSTDKPIHSLAIGLAEPDPQSTFKTDTAICTAFDQDNKRLNIISVPMSSRESPRDRDLCIFFDPPLPENSGPYTIQFQEFGSNLFGPLVNIGRDEIEYVPRRPQGEIDKVELIIYVPVDFKVSAAPRGEATMQRQLRENEINDSNRYPGLKGLGWVAEGVKTDDPSTQMWGLDLTHERQ